MKKLLHIIPGLIVLLSISSCYPEKEFIRSEGLIFGTVYNITYQHTVDLRDSISSLLNKFDMSMSTYKEGSVISKINRNESDETDEYFRNVFNRASEITAETGGAFDITIAPLVNAWGFGFAKKDSINPEMIDSVKQYVGMDMVSIRNGKVVKKYPGIMK